MTQLKPQKPGTIYFIHGMNHQKVYPPILEIEQQLQKKLPNWQIHFPEIPGYGERDPLLFDIEQIVNILQTQLQPDSYICGHSFGALLACAVALKKPVRQLILFQPWLQTWQMLPGNLMAFDAVRRASVLFTEELLSRLPDFLLKNYSSGGGQVTVSRRQSDYQRYKLLEEYPLSFYAQAIRLQKKIRKTKMKCDKITVVNSTKDYLVDNWRSLLLRQPAKILMTDGYHQQVYDNPSQTVDIIYHEIFN